ncbi:hypothetical protein JQ609_28040 [Bradyrhizobium sp. AUGA SZCCT0169]|uniref:hypothetical protein n=1 Tax=Bradyrhizobium sp. AUGA SZCCT0169 TaxID=2807663 RepID=UPI001BAC529C|nr:hypothetical protein [Bradyrhizobium sp. AUGA SZCCT0169]MBR1250759.1 hypothetical protein [Bradyrhizobium sp. AUGA SZCCT0169]
MTPKNEIQADRIRKYLGHLTSHARSSLLVEIERMQMYDEDISGFEIILAELRAEFRKSGETHHRIGNPSRYFFKPIEALFVDRSPERANSGQISRGSLSAIWEWINQDQLPSMARDYCEQMKQLIVKDIPDEARLIVAGFQSKVVKTIEGLLGSEQGVADVRRALGQYTGSRASFDDLKKILLALRLRDAIVAFDEALPSKVDDFDGEALSRIRGHLDNFAAKHPEAMPFALTMVTKHLKEPWQLARLATRSARSKNAAEIAATRYAISIAMVLDQLDDQRIALSHALKRNRISIARDILTDIYDIEYALRSSIDRIDQTDWGRKLDAVMAAVASDLKAELQTLPGNLHHVLASHTLHRHHAEPVGLAFLVQKGRNLIGLGQS